MWHVKQVQKSYLTWLQRNLSTMKLNLTWIIPTNRLLRNWSNSHTFVQEEDDIEPRVVEHVALVCYKDVQYCCQTLQHCLEQTSIDVMHLVKKLEKFWERHWSPPCESTPTNLYRCLFPLIEDWKWRSETSHLYFETSFNDTRTFYLRYIYKSYVLVC